MRRIIPIGILAVALSVIYAPLGLCASPSPDTATDQELYASYCVGVIDAMKKNIAALQTYRRHKLLSANYKNILIKSEHGLRHI